MKTWNGQKSHPEKPVCTQNTTYVIWTRTWSAVMWTRTEEKIPFLVDNSYQYDG